MMRASVIRSIAQLVRRPTVSSSVMFHPTTRSFCTKIPIDEFLGKRVSPKQVKVVTTIIFEGLEADEIKALIPFLQEKKSVNPKDISSSLGDKATPTRVACASKVTFEGFQPSEVDALGPSLDQLTTSFEMPIGNVKGRVPGTDYTIAFSQLI